MIARCLWVNETMRVELTLTRLPPGVRQTMSRRNKPSPDTFVAAADELGVPVQRAVVFEDALSGVEAGHAGGFGLVVGVDRGVGAQRLTESGADVVVDDLGELASS